jgi:hypothetical protein
MGVNNVTSLHSWSIDVTSLIEGILHKCAIFLVQTPVTLVVDATKLQQCDYACENVELSENPESRHWTYFSSLSFKLPMRITICDDDMISIAPAFRSMKSLGDMGDAWTTHGVSRLFFLAPCSPPHFLPACMYYSCLSERLRRWVQRSCSYASSTAPRLLYPTFLFFQLIHFTLELLQSDALFQNTFLFVSSIFLWIFAIIPKLRVVSLDSLTIISFSVAYAESISWNSDVKMSVWYYFE